MADSETVTALILKDVLDGIEYLWGREAVDQVAKYALDKNRSRESNRVMDELERLYSLPSQGRTDG